MTTELEVVRERLNKERSPSGRITEALRREVIAVVAQARKTGLGYREIAESIGVSFHTMMGWRQRDKRQRLKPVRMSTPPRPSPTVHGPRGMRVEGLTVAEVAELWLRLS